MKLSGELDYRIRYDVEHDLFHAQNVFNDEYIKPTFIEYVQELEKGNVELKARPNAINLLTPELEKLVKLRKQQLTKATEIIKKYLSIDVGGKITQNYLDVTKEAEQFIREVEK